MRVYIFERTVQRRECGFATARTKAAAELMCERARRCLQPPPAARERVSLDHVGNVGSRQCRDGARAELASGDE